MLYLEICLHTDVFIMIFGFISQYHVPWIRNQEIFIFNTTKAFGQVNSTCLQKNTLHIQGIKAIYHDNQVEKKSNKTKYT